MTNDQDAPDANQLALWDAQSDLDQGFDAFAYGVSGASDAYAQTAKSNAMVTINGAIARIIDIKLAMAFAKLTQTGKA